MKGLCILMLPLRRGNWMASLSAMLRSRESRSRPAFRLPSLELMVGASSAGLGSCSGTAAAASEAPDRSSLAALATAPCPAAALGTTSLLKGN